MELIVNSETTKIFSNVELLCYNVLDSAQQSTKSGSRKGCSCGEQKQRSKVDIPVGPQAEGVGENFPVDCDEHLHGGQISFVDVCLQDLVLSLQQVLAIIDKVFVMRHKAVPAIANIISLFPKIFIFFSSDFQPNFHHKPTTQIFLHKTSNICHLLVEETCNFICICTEYDSENPETVIC